MNEYIECEICGKPAITTHEIYYGTANRKVSIMHGFQVHLCNDCHLAAHYRKNIGYDLNIQLRETCQRNFEENHTRDEFLKLIGRNYL